VMLRARWVSLRALWVLLRARWVTLRARWVVLRARLVVLQLRLFQRLLDGTAADALFHDACQMQRALHTACQQAEV
jgi:hypothetical protein